MPSFAEAGVLRSCSARSTPRFRSGLSPGARRTSTRASRASPSRPCRSSRSCSRCDSSPTSTSGRRASREWHSGSWASRCSSGLPPERRLVGRRGHACGRPLVTLLRDGRHLRAASRAHGRRPGARDRVDARRRAHPRAVRTLPSCPTQVPSAESIASLLALTIVGTAFAQLILFRMLRLFGSRRLSLVTYLIPGFAVALRCRAPRRAGESRGARRAGAHPRRGSVCVGTSALLRSRAQEEPA